MEFLENINLFLEAQDELKVNISRLINYNSSLYDFAIIDYREFYWSKYKDKLCCAESKKNLLTDEYYENTISSYCSLGEKLYIGEHKDNIYVMMYDSDKKWDTADIYILDKNKEVKQ